jgi:hypothetical protein
MWDTARRSERSGRCIRHASLCTALAVFPLTVAMIETALRAVLMATVGPAPLFPQGWDATPRTAITLTPITGAANDEKFDFLGYTFGRCYSAKTGRAYLGTTPSKKRVQRICGAISEETGRSKTQLDRNTVVTTLNRMMVGWANYFCLGPVSKAYRAVERHARKRLRQWLCAKHHKQGTAIKQFPEASMHDKFGLVRLTTRTSSLPWA